MKRAKFRNDLDFEFMQLGPDNFVEVYKWLGACCRGGGGAHTDKYNQKHKSMAFVICLKGDITALEGDYIVKFSKFDFGVFEPTSFEFLFDIN